MRSRKAFSFVAIGVALAASTAIARAACSTASNTVTCTGGPSVTLSYNNGTTSGPTIAATPYPTSIAVSGGSGTVSSVSLTLHGYTTSTGGSGSATPGNASRSIGVLLVSPSGRTLEVMRSDGSASCDTANLPHCQNNFAFTIQDSGTAFPDITTFWETNAASYKPTANDGSAVSGHKEPDYHSAGATAPTTFNSAAPNGSSTLTSVFAGDTVNGTWSLFIADDFARSTTTLSSWDIAITFSAATTPSSTTLSANPPTAFRTAPGNSITFTGTVTPGGAGTPGGTVTVVDTTTSTTACTITLPATTCNATFSTEGVHTLRADYSGDSTFVSSSSSNINVFIENHSTSTGTNVVTYCNTGTVTNDGFSNLGYQHTTPYPSVIFVGDGSNTDITNSVSTVSVKLQGFTSSNTDQVRMLLVAPDGTHAFDFMSNTGSGAAATGNYTIADGFTQLPSGVALTPGSYSPAGYGILPDAFTPAPPSPAPQIPASYSYAPPMGNPNSKTFLTAFTGATAHGAWSLYLHNENGAGTSTSLATGWCLTITPATGFPTTVSVSANPVRALLGASTTFTATVTSPGHPTPNQGTVTFTENGAPLTGAPNGGVANVINGVATISTSSLPEGDHIVNAQYHDSANIYADNIGTVNVRVDKATTSSVSNNTVTYCNTGAITIPAGTVVSNDFGPAAPNPSNVAFSNLFGTVKTVTLTLKGFHDLQPGNLETLLVGPNGNSVPGTAQTFDFFTRAAGVNAFGPADITFSDAFAAASNTGALSASSGPASYGATPSYTSSPFFTLPGTLQRATNSGGFTFNTGAYNPGVGGGIYSSTNPNGTWSLYFDQLINDTGSGANGGWCLNFTENPPALTATKGPSGLHVVQGDASDSITVVVHNPSGPGSAGGVIPVTVSDTFPTGLTPTGGSGTDWTCGTPSGQTITCTSSDFIAAGSDFPTLTINFSVSPTATPGPVSNTAAVSGSGLAAPIISNSLSITIDPAPDVTVTASHTGTFTQGSTGTVTIVGHNTIAGSTTRGTTTVVDTLPSGYTLSSFSSTGNVWTCGAVSNVVTCTATQQVAGMGDYTELDLVVNIPTTSPTSVTNSVTISGGGELSTYTGNNTSTDMISVVQVPASVSPTGLATQSATINTAFGSLAVVVKDAANVVIPNFSVTFTANAGANGQSGTFDNSTATKTVSTNASGVADPGTFTANSKAGQFTLSVTAGPASTSFTLTNTPGTPANIALTSGDGQSTAINTAFAALVATVTDSGGNPVAAGTTVTFTPPASTLPSVTFAGGLTTVTTNSSGVATSAIPTANSHAGGPYNVQVSAGSATNNFALTNLPGPAANIALTDGNSQSATVNTAFVKPLKVTVTDAGGNPVATGTTVTFTPPASTNPSITFAGSVNTATTDSSGVATSAAITANTHAGGPYNVLAAAGSATNNFSLTNTPGTASQMTPAGTPQSATVGTAFATALSVTVADQFGNPVSGVQVTFTAPTGSGIATGTFAGNLTSVQATSGADGVATATAFTANTKAGSYTVTAAATGLTSANFSLTNNPGAPANVAITAGNNQHAVINTAFATNLQVTVTDSNSNTVPNTNVTFTAPATGASGTFQAGTNTVSVNTNASGVGTATTFTANNTVGGPYTVTAAAGSASASFSLINDPSTVQVTVATNVNGPTVTVDAGPAFTGSQTFTWTIGTSHTIATTTPQTGTGTQYIWLNWSDGGAISHSVTASSAVTTYTATFKTQYMLTTNVSPSTAAGSISPASGFVDAGTVVSVGATANLGYAFSNFSNGLSGSTNPQNLTVNAAVTVTANFTALPDLTISKSHPGGAAGHFSQGQMGATYTLIIGNGGPGVTSGSVSVTDTLPAGLALVSMAGTGWTCGVPNANNVCTRTDSIGVNGSYPPITVTVNVDPAAPSSVTNSATVSGAGDYNLNNNTANDPTTINPIVNVSSQVSVTQSGFLRNRSTGVWSATMTVTNTGVSTINGPVQVLLTNLSSNATMVNNTGTWNGSPYTTVSAGALAPGASASISIQFTNPTNGFITYTPVTYSGVF